jgi:hypothetical protein
MARDEKRGGAVANALLDFVMSLVRDPEAAARYAADPERAIAEAELAHVSSVDVQNLIPVVSESLSMAVPSHSWDALAAEPVSNVWASGAATAAFDAFDDRVPESIGTSVIDTDPAVPAIVDEIDPDVDVLADADLIDTAASLQVEVPLVEDVLPADSDLGGDWAQPVGQPEAGDHASGFDIFD